MITKNEILEREKRWTLIAGIASVMGVAIILATYGESSAAVRAASGFADRLREIDGDHSSLIMASIGQFVGWSLLAVPLVFLFRAAAARAPQVRGALVGVMVIAPVLIGLGSIINFSQRRGPREHIYLILIVISLVAFSIDRLVFWAQKRWFPYREHAES